MNQLKESLRQALVVAFANREDEGDAPVDAATDLLCAFAEVVRGPAANIEAIAGVMVPDETSVQILAEMQKTNALLAKLLERADRNALLSKAE